MHTFAPLESQNFRKKSVLKINNFRENSATFLQMSYNLKIFAKFQKFQLDNLVDFEKCCKTRIYLQRSAPIQPKTSEICRNFAKNWRPFTRVAKSQMRQVGFRLSTSSWGCLPAAPLVSRRFANCWQIFGKISVVFGCIGTDLSM